MIYYTYDADGVRIEERAQIRRAETREEALGETRRYYERSDFDVVDLERGSFGDCWIKCASISTVELYRKDWEAEAGPLIVQEPGSHPGGRAWWVSPSAEIMVPVLRERASCV